ncbi:MAG: ATP-binding cassette domain-containing protein [Myxococcaceae bacterium]|nr:ATP-binding cassette domain-containing protein [Myxococcaceae bacterium]
MTTKEEPKKKKKPPFKVTFGRIISLARPEAGKLAWATLFLFAAAGATLVFPQGIRVVLDEALESGSETRINEIALQAVAVFAAMGVAMALRYYLFMTVGERVVTRLRARLFKTLIDQEIGFFDGQKTGDLVSRLASDTAVLQTSVSANISMGLRSLTVAAGTLVMLFFTSKVLTGLMLAVVPPVALGAVAYGRRVRKLAKETQDALAKASAVAEESLSGIRTVRSFDAEKKEAEKYAAAVEESFELSKKRTKMGATFMGAASFAAYGAAALVFWYGGTQVIHGELSKGSLVVFLIYTMQMAFSLGALSELWPAYNQSAGAAERIFELLDRKPAIPNEGGLKPESVSGHVKWRGVEFAYPSRSDVQVLKGFELELKPGEVVALVGPSGSGKSTVASLLYRLYDPVKGEVLLDGQRLTELDAHWLRRQIGVVAQEPLLFSASVAENIRYGRPEATREEVIEAAKLANAHGFVSAFPEGYETLVGERGVQLSGGQKQRVAIARALLKNPKLLILDEATSALDAESEHLVREALDRLMTGRTTLVIAHRLSTVKDADRVVVIDSGRVAQVGRHEALVAEEGIYKRLVERQFAVA